MKTNNLIVRLIALSGVLLWILAALAIVSATSGCASLPNDWTDIDLPGDIDVPIIFDPFPEADPQPAARDVLTGVPVEWHRFDGSRASVTVKAQSLAFTPGKIHFLYDVPQGWPDKNGLNGVYCFFVWRGASWVGGKFDWSRAPMQKMKGTENIEAGYTDGIRPVRGDRVAVCVVSINGQERTEALEGVWP